jgi:phage shock protein A
MEQSGSTADRDYLLRHIASLKLSEKDLASTQNDIRKWESRVELARKAGKPDLEAAALQQLEGLRTKEGRLLTEVDELKATVGQIKAGLPHAAASERSVDPDLLEQEFRIQLGEDLSSPEDASSSATKAQFAKLEQSTAADDALTALKRKMGLAR